MIEVVISQVANGYVVKKTIDCRPSLQNQFVEGPYSYTFVTTEMDAAKSPMRYLPVRTSPVRILSND